MCATVHSDPDKAGARSYKHVWHDPYCVREQLARPRAQYNQFDPTGDPRSLYISRISIDLHLSEWTGPFDQNKVKSHLSTPLKLRPTNQGITVIHYLFDWSDLDLFTPHP